MKPLVVLVTVSSPVEAKKIRNLLLDQHLAACVNWIQGVESAYWWKGKKEVSKEGLLIIKTFSSQFARLEKVIRANHSYTVPEIISLQMNDVSAPYLRWMKENVKA